MSATFKKGDRIRGKFSGYEYEVTGVRSVHQMQVDGRSSWLDAETDDYEHVTTPVCTTPNGRTDSHGAYVESGENGKTICMFCKKPVGAMAAPDARGPEVASEAKREWQVSFKLMSGVLPGTGEAIARANTAERLVSLAEQEMREGRPCRIVRTRRGQS